VPKERPTSRRRAASRVPAGEHDAHTSRILEIERAWLLLVRSAQNTKMNEAVLRNAQLDVDLSAYPVLIRLDEQGPMRIRRLAEELHVDPSTVSRQVKTLVETGLLSSTPDESDGRASVMALTKRGEAVLRKIRDARHAMLAELIQTWSVDEQEQLNRSLTMLAQSAWDYIATLPKSR
jgi:DNA-binding MarR family transcriptional regulator